MQITPDEHGVVTVLYGNALDPEPKRSVLLSGTIGSVLDFCAKRKDDLAEIKNKVHAILNREKLSILLVTDEDEQKRYEITGTLRLVNELQKLGINNGTAWPAKTLASSLKQQRWLFRSQQEQAALITALTNVEVKVNHLFKEADDFRGNKAHEKTQQIKTDIPLEFVLVSPIAEGEDKEQFTIEIELDVVNGSDVRLYLVSPQLEERKQAYIHEKFAAAKAVFDDAGFVVIQA